MDGCVKQSETNKHVQHRARVSTIDIRAGAIFMGVVFSRTGKKRLRAVREHGSFKRGYSAAKLNPQFYGARVDSLPRALQESGYRA